MHCIAALSIVRGVLLAAQLCHTFAISLELSDENLFVFKACIKKQLIKRLGVWETSKTGIYGMHFLPPRANNRAAGKQRQLRWGDEAIGH